jgi:hypothetical protein
MLTMSVKTNISDLERGLNQFAKKELPYAVVRGLTAVAKQAQTQVRSELSQHFTIRNSFVSRGITVEPARKTDWPHAQAVVLSKDAFMTDHEQGAKREPGSLGFVAAPVSPGEKDSVRPMQEQVITPRLRARKLVQLAQSKKQYHLVTLPRSKTLGVVGSPKRYIYGNRAKRNSAELARRMAHRLKIESESRVLWALPQEVHLKKRWNFVDTVMDTRFDGFHREIDIILRKASYK